jgi:hypothetical protein
VILGGGGLRAVVRCEGAPRDLGLDQGEACVTALRGLSDSLRGLRAPRPLARDLRRHFPQLAERLEGLGRGARVPARLLLRALARELGSRPTREQPATCAAALWGLMPARTGGGAILAWTGRNSAGPWQVRQSRPENGFPSLEIVAPWFPGGVAGVNGAGLAIACTTLEAPVAAPTCTVPAFLLVQECLQRFESVEGAEQWCTHRPAGGAATILFADAAGGLSGVQVAASERARLCAVNGILASPDTPVRWPEIAAEAMATPALDRSARRALLLRHLRPPEPLPGSPAGDHGVAAVLDAGERQLWVVEGREPPRGFDLALRPL